MRQKLLHPLRERPRRRDHQRVELRVIAPSRPGDPAVARVREAGGPEDEASYTCGCGYLFCASVSTTVVCPHCGAGQAW